MVVWVPLKLYRVGAGRVESGSGVSADENSGARYGIQTLAVAASRQLARKARPHANARHRAGAFAPSLTVRMVILQGHRAL
jgi:hypothetical protein